MAAEKRATDAALESPVEILRQGLAYCQCCAPKALTGEAVAEAANTQTPWEVVETKMRWGVAETQPNPVQCAEDSDRQHWMLWC